VLCALPIVGNEPFAVVLADDLIAGDPPELRSMAELYAAEGCSVIGVVDVPRDQTASYGIVVPTDPDAAVTPITGVVEKPEPASAPSTLAVVGRYVLTPAIFGLLANAQPGRGGEIQLTDAIARLISTERVLARRLHGRRFDCGSKLGYLQATVELGLRHHEVGEAFSRYLRQRGR
jgi:UTP--glucose-1-phosphate uridylyltransferase